jgi:hypothetical protein
MKKLLYVAPHLSTGGLPQYLTKKIELLKGKFDIYLIEWADCTGGKLVVTKNKIQKLIPSKNFYTLAEDKSKLFTIIKKINPDIIHLEEIPEYFMDDSIAQKLYNVNRKYFLVETSHDSSMDTNNKLYFPDKFMFVSNWQIDQYSGINIPKILVEYPIEYITRPDRVNALKRLNLNPSKKHILHIGLFTSRKNQKEFFEYAKALPEYEFHSVGNQAENFKWYWEPLMKDKPNNLTWWDERTDVESFYQSMDLFLFTSRGSQNDKETMPLVIREALSYQIPQLLYNLEVYQNYFKDYDLISYLDFNSFDSNIKKIKHHFNDISNINEEEEAYVICTYPKTQASIDTTLECIKSLKKDNRKIIISSHCAVPKELQDEVDYVFYEKNNLLTKHTFYSGYQLHSDQYDTHINLRGEDNDRYHGPACYTSFYNPATFAKGLGIKKLHYINFDYILKDKSYIDYISKKLNNHDTFFGGYEAQEGKCYYTYFFSAKPEAILNNCKFIETEDQYNNLMGEHGAESNGIENLYYHIFKNNKGNYIEPKEKFESDAEKYFKFEDFSMVEYYTVLPTNIPNHFCPWITISNAKESKLIHYTVIDNNGSKIIDRDLIVHGKYSFWDLIKYNPSDNIEVRFEVRDLKSRNHIVTHEFNLNEDYFLNVMPNNGNFEWKGDMSKYIKK